MGAAQYHFDKIICFMEVSELIIVALSHWSWCLPALIASCLRHDVAQDYLPSSTS